MCSKCTGTYRLCRIVCYYTLGLTRYFSDLSLEDNVMTEDTCKCHCSPSSLEGDVLPCKDAVKEHQTGNSLGPSSLERLCINCGFDESSMAMLSLDSRHDNQETDINEQNVQRESTGNNGR